MWGCGGGGYGLSNVNNYKGNYCSHVSHVSHVGTYLTTNKQMGEVVNDMSIITD